MDEQLPQRNLSKKKKKRKSNESRNSSQEHGMKDRSVHQKETRAKKKKSSPSRHPKSSSTQNISPGPRNASRFRARHLHTDDRALESSARRFHIFARRERSAGEGWREGDAPVYFSISRLFPFKW